MIIMPVLKEWLSIDRKEEIKENPGLITSKNRQDACPHLCAMLKTESGGGLSLLMVPS